LKETIKIYCQLEKLVELRKKCRILFERWSISKKDTISLIHAIDEACANAIIHGHSCNENKHIEVSIALSNGTFTAMINDVGQINEDLASHINKPLNNIKKERKKGGLGLKIIHQVMDNVQYILKDGKYSCLMVKNI